MNIPRKIFESMSSTPEINIESAINFFKHVSYLTWLCLTPREREALKLRFPNSPEPHCNCGKHPELEASK